MIPTGILFSLLAMFFWGMEEFFLKKAVDAIKTTTTMLINTVTGMLLSVIVVWLFIDEPVTLISGRDFAFVVLTVALSYMSYLYFYFALERQKLSLIGSIDESWIIVSVVLAMVLLGEQPTWIHLTCIVVVLLGTFLISVDFSNRNLIKGSGFAIASIILIGITVPMEKIIVGRIGEGNAIIYLSCLILPMILVGKWLMGVRWHKPDGDSLKAAVYSGVVDGFAFIFFLLALKRAPVSIVSPIVASTALVSVFLARIFLHERMDVKEIVGAALIVVGVAVLSFFVPEL